MILPAMSISQTYLEASRGFCVPNWSYNQSPSVPKNSHRASKILLSLPCVTLPCLWGSQWMRVQNSGGRVS